ncbi:MAG: NUDIX hydrolase [Bosea sp. (in: a-proteobacteria)]
MDDLIALERLEARLEPYDWTFPLTHAAEIEASWAKETALRPATFDGRVLLQHRGEVRDGVFEAGYFTTTYKPFLSWQRMGWPGEPLRNAFAMAALRARDGAFLAARMGTHTANAGKIYFAAGTPDMDDVLADGTVDLAGSVTRELEEETGLAPSEVSVGQGWIAVVDSVRIAFMRPVFIDLPADEARALILSRIALQAEPELSDIVIIRSPDEIVSDTSIMPRFMQRYLAHMFRQV